MGKVPPVAPGHTEEGRSHYREFKNLDSGDITATTYL